MAEVVFVDTSVLLNLLAVPGKNSDRDALTAEFKAAASAGVLLIIPIAAVVEVGNHIAQLADGTVRRDRATSFTDFLRKSIDGAAPWVVSGASWNETFLRRLIDGHGSRPGLVELSSVGLGAGDASILHELDRYRSRSDLPSALPVRLWTLDTQLAAYA